MGDLKRNFNRSEFACKCGCGFDEINPLISEMCQELRDFIGVPLRINSGCRCPERNKEAGSTSPNHVHGNAADISCQHYNARELANFIQELYLEGKMQGLEYCLMEGGWVHIDCDRPRKNRFQTVQVYKNVKEKW